MPANPQDLPKVVALPAWILAAILALGILLDSLWPAKILPEPFSVALGLVLVAVSILLRILAIREMSRARTTITLRQPTAAIATTGIFGISRNPIYLGMVLLCLGFACLFNSLWIFLLAAPLAVVLQKGVIEPEEDFLERTFGDIYRRYKSSVRRWI